MAFTAALGALRAHQSWIDVIGNNLANANTPGYKSSRATFRDLLSITKRNAQGPTGAVGGTNPLQIGLGSQLSSVDKRMGQGGFDDTGRSFDLALLGSGFFVVTDGAQTLYSRVGTFGLDAAGTVVDTRSGNPALDRTGSTVTIDTTAVLPPEETSQATLRGNLPAVVTGPLSEQLSTAIAFTEGNAAQMSGGASGTFTVPAGETWTMELVINGGAPQEVSIAGTGAALTAADVVNEINDQTEDVVASVGPGSTVVLTSERTGTASSVKAVAGQTGKDLKSLFGLGDFVQGTENPATATTDLNALPTNLVDYTLGDEIEVAGSDVDGTSVVGSFTYGVDGTTLGDLVSFLDGLYGQSAVAFDASAGRITVTANTPGEAELSLALSDNPNQTGRTDWSASFFAVTTNGTGPDQVTSSAEVYDAAGSPHVLTLDYQRQADGTWTLTGSVPASEGSVLSAPVAGLSFNEDGSLQTPSTADLVIQFNGLSAQTIALDLGTSGQFDGLTSFGDPPSAIVSSQNGYGSGELSAVEVLRDGTIEGYFTNGESQTLGTLGIATFTNEEGLDALGNNYYRASANSGTRVLGAADTGQAGEVISGSLETSNVDTAEEFVRLIQAQRGFQANARVITVVDELLAEVVNIV